MAETFKFELVSPERILVSEDVAEVLVPGSEGDFTVLPLHAPVIALVRPGILHVTGGDGKRADFYVRGGLSDVGPDRLIVLAEQAIPLADLNRETIAQEIKNAEEDLADAQDEDKRRQAQDSLDQLRLLSEALNLAA